ncbi:MAG TPA: crosslink repair DNA glycosylase YcaQ family protein [Acidimicrobiales bacterium]|nr:crosslink repair DNA glycosylase YcaQ family protein [Acidimicrobiales bacterium]
MDSLSLPEARRLALQAQGFGKKSTKSKINLHHMKTAMNAMKVVQLDAVPIVIRSQYIPFYSRLGNYDVDLYENIAYRKDEWFELWAHEASIAPVQMEPYFRFLKSRAKRGETWKGLYKVAMEHPNYVKQILREVKLRGPLEAKDLKDPRPKEGTGWGSRSMGQLALNWLYRIGEVGIRRGKNFEKRYDLLSRIVPERILTLPTPPEETAIKNLFVTAIAALGVGTAVDVSDYFRIRHSDTKRFLNELVESGKIREIAVESWGGKGYIPNTFKIPKEIKASTVLTPFDPIVWNRKRLERLFNFSYKLEIYKPKAKRQYGYYVMPYLLDDKIVARFDLANKRETQSLHVIGAFVEKESDPGKVGECAHKELSAFASFLGSSKLEIERHGNLFKYLKN